MKPNSFEDIFKNNPTKRHKSSTDIEKILIRKKLSNNQKNSIVIKDNNEEKSYICNHKSNFISFCEICSLDLCSVCEEKHINHKIIKFTDIIPTKEEIDKINKTIQIYIEDYNKLIEEIYKWKKELDKKIFYFEEQIKNNPIINKNIEFVKKFDFSKNNNYSSLSKYKNISEMLTKPENIDSNNDNINNETEVGCYSFRNYINSKKTLDRIIDYENEEDFILKSNDIIKLIFSFLSKKIFKYENNFNEEIKILKPINNNDINENFFTTENIYNNTYTFSNTSRKESNINEINIKYLNSTTINDNDFIKKQEIIENIENRPIQKSQIIGNQSKSIGNIFLEEEKKEELNDERNNSLNYTKFKKNIIKSSTLRRLNIINAKNRNIFRSKEMNSNCKNKNESNSANYINSKVNKKATLSHIYSITNKNNEVYKYIPKIKKQNRVYTINNKNNSNNLNTINSFNNIYDNSNKKNIYRHKKLNSVSISNYSNQSFPIEFNKYNNNNYENLATLNNSTGNYTNLIKPPTNLDSIQNNNNMNLDRKNITSCNSIMSNLYSLNTLDTNNTPSSYLSIKETNTYILDNKKNNIKKKLLTNSNTRSPNNYNTILETPITFSSKLSSNNNTLKYKKASTNNINEFSTYKKIDNYNYENNNKYLIDSNKNLYIGLELGNSECNIGIINQNNYNNIELFNLENKERENSIPTIISFDNITNEIKIGNEAENNILNNPSQTIFNILKIIGKNYKQINNDIDLWPFKLYYNEDLCRPYVKISNNKQKNRIFFFEDLLSIFLKKLFDIFFSKIKLLNNNNNIINLILVVTVPNNYNYLQRKIIEKIFQTQIFPQNKEALTNNIIIYENNINSNNNTINNKKENFYSGYKIILKDIKIENASSLAALCLFNNKIKSKYNIENIFNEKSDNHNDNNKKYKINIINNNQNQLINNKLNEINNEYFSTNTTNKDIKERESNNSGSKHKNGYKNILVINIDGGFTNISLGTISQNKPKEKNSPKIKNSKNIKKFNSNILEIKEISGSEFGEEDFIDIYINYCLKKFDDKIYKECIKSPIYLAKLRRSILVEKKHFKSTEKDHSISINLPHKFLDIKIDIKQKDYEKSCQEMFSKIIIMVKNVLKKSKLSEKNIDIIMLIASKITTDKINPMLKNIFVNSKIISNNCNNFIATGATMQALNNNMIKSFYKFIDITNMNFGIETLNGIMDVIVPKGLKIPVQKIKYVKIKNNDNNDGENMNHLNKYLEINIFEGDNKLVKNNRLISCANIDKRNFKEEKIGDGFIELLVEFEINNYSSLSVYVLDVKNFKRRFECLTNLDMVKG